MVLLVTYWVNAYYIMHDYAYIIHVMTHNNHVATEN